MSEFVGAAELGVEMPLVGQAFDLRVPVGDAVGHQVDDAFGAALRFE